METDTSKGWIRDRGATERHVEVLQLGTLKGKNFSCRVGQRTAE